MEFNAIGNRENVAVLLQQFRADLSKKLIIVLLLPSIILLLIIAVT